MKLSPAHFVQKILRIIQSIKIIFACCSCKSLCRTSSLFLCSNLLIVSIGFGQLTQFNFNYSGISPTCNPFKDDPQSFSGATKWKVSHGTPEVKDLYGNLFFNLANLKAEKSSTGTEKNEGLFISYNFLCTHAYDITVALRHGEGDNIGFQLKAANGLKEQSNTTCALDTRQTPTKSEDIFIGIDAYDGSFGNFDAMTITDWKPQSNFSFFWLFAHTALLNKSGSIYVDYVTIVDKGSYRSTCPSSSGSSGSSYPLMTGLEARVAPLMINTTLTNYDFLWDEMAVIDNWDEDWDHRGYNVWVNNQFAWDNYNNNGDTFRPEISPEGKAFKTFVGSYCGLYKLAVQGLFSSGAPHSKYTATQQTWIDVRMANVSTVLTQPFLILIPPPNPASTPPNVGLVFATQSIILKPGFSFGAVPGTALIIKVTGECDAPSSGRTKDQFEDQAAAIKSEIYLKADISESKVTVTNPVTHSIKIHGLDPREEYVLTLINLQGKTFISNQSHGREATLDVSSLAAGVYVLLVRSHDKTQSFKIIKN